MDSTYQINKGINKPLEFKGLKAQYITYLALGLIGLLLVFAILFIGGVSVYICLPVTFIAGAALFSWVFRFSQKYGVYGLMKEAAYRGIPTVIHCRHKLFNKTKGTRSWE